MRRVCLLIAALAVASAMAIASTGGVVVRLGAIRASARSPVNPLLLALAAGTAAWALSPRGRRGRTIASDLRTFALALRGITARPPPWLAPLGALSISATIIVVGVVEGALVAGGSDAYGYVSQAEAWASGTFRFDEPLIRELEGRVLRDALVPLGYQAIGERGAIVPMYPPGLPMVMGVFQRVGGRDAVFYVVPLLAGLAVWATYLMGARLAGKAVGLSSATLLATSPSFLYQLTAAPMSDIAVTAWWALSLCLVLFDTRLAVLGSGLAAGAAILTRPNLVPLAVIPAALLLWGAVRERPISRRAILRGLLFVAGVAPGCLAIGALYAIWYGSPLMSGYGSLSALYDWRNLGPNLLRYPAWLVDSETPIVIAAFAAPWLVDRLAQVGGVGTGARRVAWSWLCFAFAVFASYVFYEAFNAWWYVRFLLPAFPPVLMLTSVTLVAATMRLPFTARVLLPIAIVGIVSWHGVSYARDHHVFEAYSERKYAIVGDYVEQRLPDRAALLTKQHSGSVRYYSGRATVRFDLIPETSLDATLDELRRSGYHPYILLESWEVPEFQQRYATRSPLGALDWPPIVLMRESNIRIYDPADRPASLAGRPPLTEIVP